MTAPIMRLAALLALLLVAACADGLVYGERTSFNLASVRVNDDPAEPVVVKLGFDRDVVLVAPPIGGEVVAYDDQGRKKVTPGGEAVSQFSTFTLKSAAPFLRPGETADLLAVQTRFATGHAALAIASEPEVVAAFLGLRVPPAKEQVADALAQLEPDQQDRLCALAGKDFDDLTEAEVQEAGALTGFQSLYDRALHADLRSACERQS
jgi:NADPH-dependent 2,4-dienoyl-CoA reductase/sulfur reductase-like enzyme